MAAPKPDAESLDRKTLGVLAATLALSATVYALVFFPDFVRMGDNQSYYLLGKGLLEGRGYTSYWTGEAVRHTHWPPGYPILLAGAMALGITSITGLKLVNGAVLLVGLLVTYGWARRLFEDRWVAGITTAAVGLNVVVVQYASRIMSEVPFLTVSMGALACAIRVGRRPGVPWWRDGWFYALVALMVAAFYIRTLGVALIAGCILGMILDGRARAAVVGGALTGVGIAPWILFVRGARSHSYTDYLSAIESDTTGGTIGYLWQRIADNAVAYGGAVFPETMAPGLAPVLELLPGSGWGLTILFGALTAWGLFGLGREGLVPAAYLAATAGVLLLWPSIWAFGRFLIPTVPVLYGLVTVGAWDVLRRVGGQAVSPALLLPFLLLLLPALKDARAYARNPVILRYTLYEQIAEAVRQEARPEDKVVAYAPQSMYYLTEQPTLLMPPSDDPRHVMYSLDRDGVDLVAITGDGATTPAYRYLVPAIQTFPERFHLVASIPKPADEDPIGYPYVAALYRVLQPEPDEAAAYGP